MVTLVVDFVVKKKMSQFVGKWKVESEENLDELFKACGKSTFHWLFKSKLVKFFILIVLFKCEKLYT